MGTWEALAAVNVLSEYELLKGFYLEKPLR